MVSPRKVLARVRCKPHISLAGVGGYSTGPPDIPSFKEGSLCPSSKCNATLIRAQRGRSEVGLLYDLPRRADFKEALHLLDRRVDPSLKEGISFSCLFSCLLFCLFPALRLRNHT